MKRQVLVVLFTALVLILVACAPKPTPTPTPKPTPTATPVPLATPTPTPVKGEGSMVFYGMGSREKYWREVIIAPFEAKTGCKVTFTGGISSEIMAKLMAQKDNPQYDVTNLDSGPAKQAGSLGLLQKFDPNIVTEAKNLYPPPISDPDGWYMPTKIAAAGIVINTEAMKKYGFPKPTSWLDIGNPAYKGRIAMRGIDVQQMLETVAILSRLLGSNESNVVPAFDFLESKVKPNILAIVGGGEWEKLMVEGSAWLGVGAGGRGGMLVMENKEKLELIYPKEGVAAYTGTLEVVKGARSPICAQLFMNNYATLAVQNNLWSYEGGSPARPDATMPEEGQKAFLYGKEQVMSALRLDDVVMQKDKKNWYDMWNARIAK
ncbi:MAG: extracellular solute-binding protein [Chloroflexi bacterium]|nr:extracellular solute-binding protein [Chloroflexota bacterium]